MKRQKKKNKQEGARKMTRFDKFRELNVDGFYFFKELTDERILSMIDLSVNCIGCPCYGDCDQPCQERLQRWLREEEGEGDF